jgi:hypothetical protein
LNNKMIRVYDRRQNADRTLGFGASTLGTAGTGVERAFVEFGGPGFYNSPGNPGEGTPITGQEFQFTTSGRKGQWVKVEWQFTSPTSTAPSWNAGNGIIRMWVDNTLTIECLTASQSPANTPMRGGYLHGFPNSPYANTGSYMYMADFAVSSTGRV